MNSITEHIENYPTFEWGKSDCVKFVADYFGIDSIFHENKRQALLMIKEAGSFENLIDQYLKRKDIAFSSRGDAVMVKNDTTEKALGICDGEYVLCNTDSGVVRVSMNRGIYCWGNPCHKF